MLAVDVDGTVGRLARAGQADADVRGLRLARAVDDAAHHRERHRFHAFVSRLPVRHLLANVVLDPLRQLLKRGARRPAAPGTRGHARRERAQAERLEQLAGGVHLFAAVAAGLRRQRDANRVADAFREQHAHRRRRPHEPLQSHAGFGEAEMQRLVGLARQRAIDRNQIARARGLARDDDLIAAQAAVDGERGRLDGRQHHALVDDLFRRLAQIAIGVLLHLRDDELLIERAAVDADAHRLAVIHRDLADRRELLVAPASGADVARVDAVLVERRRAIGKLRQEQMPVVVEVADERRVASGVDHPLLDLGHRGGGLRQVDGDAHHFRSGFGQLDALRGRRARVGGIRHRHRLDDDGRAAADLNAADFHADRLWSLSIGIRMAGLHASPATV